MITADAARPRALYETVPRMRPTCSHDFRDPDGSLIDLRTRVAERAEEPASA